MKQKTTLIQFRATKEEADKIKLYAKKEGMNISNAMRGLIGEKLFYYHETHNRDFTNDQVFKVGDRVEFYIKNKKDKFAGVHTVKKVKKLDIGWGIQTDITQKVAEPKDLFVHVHWFRPAPSGALGSTSLSTGVTVTDFHCSIHGNVTPIFSPLNSPKPSLPLCPKCSGLSALQKLSD